MKRAVLILLGGGFLLVVALVFFASRSNALLNDATLNVTTFVDAICKDWDASELLARGTPELCRVAPLPAARHLFSEYSREFGAFVRSDPPDGRVNFSLLGQGATTARFILKLHCEKAIATCLIEMVLYDEKWYIGTWYIKKE